MEIGKHCVLRSEKGGFHKTDLVDGTLTERRGKESSSFFDKNIEHFLPVTSLAALVRRIALFWHLLAIPTEMELE